MSALLDSHPCRAPDGTLGRRRTLADTSLVVLAERWIPGRGEWWLDARFADTAWAPASGDALPDGPDDLTTDLGPRPGGERPALVHEAIVATRASVVAAAGAIAAELPWAAPGTPDYDREFDHLARVRAAVATLEALCAERRLLLG